MEDKQQSEWVIYGRQPVYEALRSSHDIRKVVIASETDRGTIRHILNWVDKRGIELVYDKKALIQNYCGPVVHQGVVAFLSAFDYLPEKQMLDDLAANDDALVLILDQVQDPHNLGAIIRTAEIAHVSAVILPEKGSADITSTVAKTSAGAIFHCPIHRTTNLWLMLKKLQESGFRLNALAPNHDQHIYNTDLCGKLALVIGSEGKGVRKNIQKQCDQTISIPGWGKVDSLNASVSTAVVLFEAVRQRRFA